MSAVAAALTSTVPSYPATAVGACLKTALLSAIRRRFERKGHALPENDSGVAAMAIKVDSLTVVALLSKLDRVLPFKVTESVVKAGGYPSINGAIIHLIARIENQWNKHHSGEKA